MRTLSLVPLLGWFLLSCGSSQPGDDPAPGARPLQEQNGTRLKRVYIVGADGAQAAMWFRDTKLNIDCGFQPVSGGNYSGSWMCLPIDGSGKPDTKYIAATIAVSP